MTKQSSGRFMTVQTTSATYAGRNLPSPTVADLDPRAPGKSNTPIPGQKAEQIISIISSLLTSPAIARKEPSPHGRRGHGMDANAPHFQKRKVKKPGNGTRFSEQS